MPEISSLVSSKYIFALQSEKHTISFDDIDKIYLICFTAQNSTSYVTRELEMANKRKKEPFKINGIIYLIIGLAATSVLLIILYLNTHLLEKCHVRNRTF